MSMIDLVDRSGNKLPCWEYDGMYLEPITPGHPKDHLEALASLSSRPDDIFIAGYSKSGHHWLKEITSMLIRRKLETTNSMMLPVDFSEIEQLEKMESPRIFNTHLHFRHLPRSFKAARGKIVYAMRNPKDVAVSYYHCFKELKHRLYSGTWDDWFENFLTGEVGYGSWFSYVLEWERIRRENPEYPILFVQFEELLKDGLAQIKQLASFLECDVDDEFLSGVEKKCRFANVLLDRTQSFGTSYMEYFTAGTKSVYRKGVIGDWKNYFSEDQNKCFDGVYEKKMANSVLREKFLDYI